MSILATYTNAQGPCYGYYTRVWLATDCCGNTNTCSFDVIVQRPILSMSISHEGHTIIVSYSDGVLQEATSIFGPWTDVPGAMPPSYSTSGAGPHKFYRVRCP